jgi:purine-binding chemotaxis protein CheW
MSMSEPLQEYDGETLATGHYLTVVVGRELFAISIACIREVINCPRLTHVPLAPPAVPGVINLRGAVVPVLDLSVRLGRTPTVISKRTCIVVVEVAMEDGLRPVGMLVDAVEAAIERTPDMLEPKPAFGSGLRADFQAGMLRLEQRFVTVLDMTTVVATNELEGLVNEQARSRSMPARPGA